MSTVFLIPFISLFDIHDAAIREWFGKLDDDTIQHHLEYPFRLDRFFPESTRNALKSADNINDEILQLLDVIDPQAVFLDISTDFTILENRYNERLVSPQEFWSEYYELLSSDMEGAARSIYDIYIKDIIERKKRLIENKENLPLSVVFYGLDSESKKEIIPVYEEVLEKDGDFLLKTANVINEITSFRETPKHIWYSPMKAKKMAIAYEETARFYAELLSRLKRMLKFKVRDHIVKNLSEKAREFVYAYEKFLDYKLREDEIITSNIIEGLRLLKTQSDYPEIVIYCNPMNYSAIKNNLETSLNENTCIGKIDIAALLDKMRHYNQKNMIMQNNYDVALDIIGRRKPEKYRSAILVPT